MSSTNSSRLGLQFAPRLIVNIVPFPTWDLTDTFPPYCSMMDLHMERPRPVPSLLRWAFSSNFPKSMKSFFMPSSVIPAPVSMILITSPINLSWSGDYNSLANDKLLYLDYCCPDFSNPLSKFLLDSSLLFLTKCTSDLSPSSTLLFRWCKFKKSIASNLTIIFPLFGVNFRAFDKKFSRIWRYLLGSPHKLSK